ncbi:MAG TPA: alternative ribosome rescue aminoacyl-tRNA hydrolase ArfB [Bacteroidales bacterium]|nr:alternative ribosome rescue aminoacyl-tRNA hydrolase ArfB [Bacteroidales bacterium]
MMIDTDELTKELKFRASRSSGKGGQNVNKVSTKVELIFDVAASLLFSEEDKQQILSKSGRHLKDDGSIHITCSEGRSQYLNKKRAVEKLMALIEKSLKQAKKRIPTGIPDAEKEKRISEKKIQSEKKQSRRKLER